MTAPLGPSYARYHRRIVHRWQAMGRSYTDRELDELIQKFIDLARQPVPDVLHDDQLFRRASGQCVCNACGLEYIDHPESVHLEWLHVLCDGTFVKL